MNLNTSKFKISLSLITLFLILTCAAENGRSDLAPIHGEWQGEFMPGNNFLLILNFDTTGTEMGLIKLYQSNIQIQDDPLSKIKLTGNKISFYIQAKGTTFEGEITDNSQTITGNFYFPDGSVHPLFVKKVNAEIITKIKEEPLEDKNCAENLNKKYNIKSLKMDLRYLVTNIKKHHPQLYLYLSKEDFNSLVGSIENSIKSDMKEDDFFRLLAPLVAKIGCSHTGIRPSQHFSESLNECSSYLPLNINFNNDKAFVIDNFSNPAIKSGSQIFSINGLPVEQALEKMIQNTPADAYNVTAKLWQINNQFSEMYSQNIGNRKTYLLEGTYKDGKFTIEIPGISYEQLKHARQNSYPEMNIGQNVPYTHRFLPGKKSAVLTVKSFTAQNFEDYNRFLADFFKKIKSEKIENLIIDVRDNMGGHPFFAAELLSYIMQTKFTYFEEPRDNQEFQTLLQPMNSKINNFKGKIYIFMNGGCLSTTGHFLSLVKYHDLATLVGENAGGSFYCNDNSIQLRLPNTGIQVNLPRTTFQTAAKGFHKGDLITPDISVKPSLEDLILKRDSLMNSVLSLL